MTTPCPYCSWIAAASGVVSFVIFLPGIFSEHFIADREFQQGTHTYIRGDPKLEHGSKEERGQEKPDNNNNTAAPSAALKPPKVPLLVLTWCYFSALFNYVVLETLPSKLAMDQWGWSAQVTCDWWRPRHVTTVLVSDWSMSRSTLWRTWASSCRGRGCWAWQCSPPSDPCPGANLTNLHATLYSFHAGGLTTGGCCWGWGWCRCWRGASPCSRCPPPPTRPSTATPPTPDSGSGGTHT